MSTFCSKELIKISLIVLIFNVLFFNSSNAQGNLLITPRRVVFDGSRRVMELNLANTGKDTAKYNISIIQYRMNEDGSFTEITEPDPGQRFADKNIRFFPRSVTLGPNEGQVVKMQVTNIDKLESGEYRSHVYFRSVPKQEALGEPEKQSDSTSVSVRLIPIFGISIPVIIRIGQNETKIKIEDFNFKEINDTTCNVELSLIRDGNMSIYGDLKFYHISPSGKETQIGAINGIAVYTPNNIRKLSMNIYKLKSDRYNVGKIKALYVSQSDSKPVIYSESEFVIVGNN